MSEKANRDEMQKRLQALIQDMRFATRASI